MRHLFVYGTLRRASPHHFARELARQADFIDQGRMQGRLYALGWYPGMLPSADPQDWVRGDVFSLRDPDAILRVLDDYEGSQFERVPGTVWLDSGARIQCWVYLYRGQPTEESRIR